MRIIKPTSRAATILIIAFAIFVSLKLVGFISQWSWWIVFVPLIIVISSLVIYAFAFMLNGFYRERKYKRQQENSERK